MDAYKNLELFNRKAGYIIPDLIFLLFLFVVIVNE
jgi:hypothetical protein